MTSEVDAKFLRENLRGFVDNELEPAAGKIDRTDRIPDEIWQKMRDMRLFSLTLPKEQGGVGLKWTDYFFVLEELSRTGGFARVIVHQINGLSYNMISKYGNEAQKERFLSLMAKGEFLFAFGVTEPDRGTGADMGTTATKKGDKYVLNGQKHLITLANVSDATVVFAVTDETRRKSGGITAFIVEPMFSTIATPNERRFNLPAGLEMENLPLCMGSRGLYEGWLTFTDCEIPASAVLGKEGQGLDIALDVLDESRASIAASCLGLGQKMMELAVERAKQRVTFGKPIAERQAIQQMIAEMATDIQALRLMVYDVAEKFDAGIDIKTEASMAKLFGLSALRNVSDKALEIFGGIGYSSKFPIERMYRDARSLWLEEGTPTIQKLVICRDILKRY
ncbi:MAG: acyl-CoA dehydrogenase family protein [Thermodesulfobacteriota bacterium]